MITNKIPFEEKFCQFSLLKNVNMVFISCKKTLTTFDLSSDISGAIHPNVPAIPYLVVMWV